MKIPTRLDAISRRPDHLNPMSGHYYHHHHPPIHSIYLPVRAPPVPDVVLGYLTNRQTACVLTLYGHSNHSYYPGHTSYGYHTLLDNNTVVPIRGPDNRPLYTQDTVYVPGRDGVWTVTLYGPGTCGYTSKVW